MLDKQVQIYSCPTSSFNTPEEDKVYKELSKLRTRKKHLVEIKNKMKQNHRFVRGYDGDKTDYNQINESIEAKYKEVLASTDLNSKIKSTKAEYIELIKNNTSVRELNPESLNEYRVISIFESAFTRAAGFKTNELYEDAFVVEVYFYDIMAQLILNGCVHNGEEYQFGWASAGQIRQKKIVMIKKSLWKKIAPKLMCGLTEERINEMGGINTNKYLVYLALSASATDRLWGFDIDRSIVLDDIDMVIKDHYVDYLDYNDYSVTRTKDIDINITVMDGCGMISPEAYDRNTMVRAPWIKGLMTRFDFKEFIREFGGNPVVKDIYGDEHDIFKEDIQYIFTKSQFKMWKYYKNWEEYKKFFKQCECEIGICNPERDKIPNAVTSYQPLQTITEYTPSDIDHFVKRSNVTLKRISTDKYTMLRVFGADDSNENPDNYQQALMMYNELLTDSYSKFKLRQIKDSLVKGYKAGKLEIMGKYTFLIPDMFGCCEYWFLGDKEPRGLLKDGEVSCKLYPNRDKLCLIRSPHLFVEHQVKKNVTDDLIEKYFNTNGVYVSNHDLISLVLMCDWDGDTSLVVADPKYIATVERNCKRHDVVPLYYELKKAQNETITDEGKVNSLFAAFSTNMIGLFANKITKIWSNVDWHKLNDEQRKRHLDLVKFMVMRSNAAIDSAKTKWVMPTNEQVEEETKVITKTKVPRFFMYAKKRNADQVYDKVDNIMSAIEDRITNPRLKFTSSGMGKLNYHYLMNNEDIKVDDKVVDEYTKLAKRYHYRLNIKEDDYVPANLNAVVINIKRELQEALSEYNISDITDQLVEYLYNIKKDYNRKEFFWQVLGDIVVENMKRKLPQDTIQCERCGTRIVPKSNRQKYCPDCGKIVKQEHKNEWKRRHYLDVSTA